MRRYLGPASPTALIVVLAAAVMLAISVPQTISAFANLPGDSAWWQAVRKGQASITDDELTRLIESRRTAVGRYGKPQSRYELGVALIEFARRGNADNDAVTSAREAAVRHLEASVASAPLNALSWLHLAIARQAAGQPNASTAEALTQSMLTGRYFPTIAEPRMDLVLRHWESFDALGRRIARDQLVMMTQADARVAAKYANSPRYGRLVRALTGLPPDDDR